MDTAIAKIRRKAKYRIRHCLSSLILPSLAITFAVTTAPSAMVVGGLTRQRTARVGDTYRGTIVLRNREQQPEEVKIYQTDYTFFSDGTTRYAEAGKLKRSNADWVTFGPARLTIPPKGDAAVNYTVEVPNGKALKGTYWSILMVEPIGEHSPESAIRPLEGTRSFGVRQVVRYGIQMVTNIGDTGAPKPRFLKTELLPKEEGGRVLQVDLENRGDRWMKPLLWVELFDQQGRSIGKFEGGAKRIYPGTSVRYQIDLTNVPEGKYKALVVGDAGGDQVFGATYTLNIQKRGNAE